MLFLSLSISTKKQSTNKINKLISDTEIILTLKGNNTQKILGFGPRPSEVYINGERINVIGNSIDNLVLEENIIELRYNGTLTSCNSMFADLHNITKITFQRSDFNGTDVYDMFSNCKNLISLDLRNFDSSSVTDMSYMFAGCNSLKSLDLGNLNTSSAIRMTGMFYQCTSLTSLNLNNFDTSSVKDMDYMFFDCINLISVDLSSFDTSSVTSMECMFYNCSSLQTVDISNFETQYLYNIVTMFYYCSSLVSLDLSKFNTYMIDMTYMFCGCSSLISLDLSGFNTSFLESIDYMFYDCHNLISLDLSNFDTSDVGNMYDVFYNCSNNLVYCLYNNTKTVDLSNEIYYSYNNYGFKDNNNCSDICFSKDKKIILDTKQCVLNCTENSPFEYKNICYSSCPNEVQNSCNNNNIYYTSFSSDNYLNYNTVNDIYNILLIILII